MHHSFLIVSLLTTSQVVGLELVKIILFTLPYALVASGDAFYEQATDLLQKTEIVAQNTLAIESFVEPYVGETEEKPIPYNSIIGLLQKQLQKEAASGWKFACIPRFSKHVLGAKVQENGVRSESQKHRFPSIVFPTPINPGSKLLFPEAYFSIFADLDIEVSDLACHNRMRLIDFCN
jgi:nuclear cap-binding protein subunit 1